ncbi:MAG: hypothetical protein JNM93_13645 [Bacteriovoracaceae bacterium]|nr:hypothetical protein [Bacteriovoracaceae bacterium]
MNKFLNLFKTIDTFIFAQIDVLKTKPEYNQLIEGIARIDDEIKDFVKLAATVVFLGAPLVIIALIWYGNTQLTSQIQIRKDFIKLASSIIENSKQIQESSAKIISSTPVDSQTGFNSRLSQILTTAGVDVEKIQVSNFVREDTAGNIIRSEGDFRFTNLTTDELTKLFIALLTKERMKISTIRVTKGQNNMLNGNFRVVHFGKTEVIDDSEE